MESAKNDTDLLRLLIIVLRMGKHWAGKWPKERQGWEMDNLNLASLTVCTLPTINFIVCILLTTYTQI